MHRNLGAIEAIRPEIVERSCGGWLAHAPAGAVLTIGVTAESEGEARQRFGEALALWRALLDNPPGMAGAGS